MSKTIPAPHLITIYCSAAIVLFALLGLVIPSGYSVGAVLLLIGGIYAYIKTYHQPLLIDKKTHYLLLVLALFSLEGVINALWHGLSGSTYDKTLRFALAIPAFYLIRWAQPKLHWVWLGLIGGGLATGLTAYYEKFMLGMERAGGYTHTIQFGNLSMLLSLFCVAGLGWAFSLKNTKQRRLFIVLLLLGAISALISSLLSGSRGGWVGLPFVFLVLYKSYHQLFSLRIKLVVAGLILLSGATVLFTPQLNVQHRIQSAVSDVEQYYQGNSNTSVGARFEMWQGAVQLIQAKPLLGWGKDHYNPAIQALIDQGRASPVISEYGHAHNDFLDQTAKHGILGLIVLLALYAVPIWYFSAYLQHQDLAIRAVATAGTLLPVAYIDFGLTQSFLAHNSGIMMYAFWLVIWAGYLQNRISCDSLTSGTALAATAQ